MARPNAAGDAVEITQQDRNLFTVRRGNQYHDQLTWEEMIGLVAAATMPEPRPCLHWLRTAEQFAAERKRLAVDA